MRGISKDSSDAFWGGKTPRIPNWVFHGRENFNLRSVSFDDFTHPILSLVFEERYNLFDNNFRFQFVLNLFCIGIHSEKQIVPCNGNVLIQTCSYTCIWYDEQKINDDDQIHGDLYSVADSQVYTIVAKQIKWTRHVETSWDTSCAGWYKFELNDSSLIGI